MLLVITNSRDATTDFLCERLQKESVAYRRFNTDIDLSQMEVSYEKSHPVLRYRSEEWSPKDFSDVWFRRPEPLSLDMEMEAAERIHTLSEWSEALEGFLGHIPIKAWMNHPSMNVCASHKMEQLSRPKSMV